MEPKQLSFWREKFDVLLLAFFLLLFSLHALYGVGDGFAQRSSDLFSGALLGLVTGKMIQAAKTKPPELPPIEPPKEGPNV